MADNLVCGETSESWIIDNDDEINFGEIDYNHQLFSKGENFGSIPMIDDERIIEMLEKEIEFCPGTDYVKRLCSGDLDLCVRNQALDWILKVCDFLSFDCFDLFFDQFDRSFINRCIY